MERRYETTESDTNINNKGGLHYSVQYNPSSQGTPGYQRLHREDGKAKELNRPLSSIFATLLEALLCAVALCFIVLAGLAVWMKDRPTGDNLGSQMERVMKLGPTVYPILFAALFSRSLKNIGRYHAQKGTRLGSLWILMNTSTVSDPVAHLLTIPTSILVWCLLPLWAMSPIGGQGSLRLMYRANVTNIRHHELRYLDNGPLGNTFAYYVVAVGNDGGYTGSMKDVYSAGLMQSTSTKTSPLDQWGNVKIPRLPEANASKADTNGWIPVPQDAVQVEAYSSLFGLPIVGLEEFNDRDLNFTVETAYLDLSCPPIDYVPNTPSNHDFSILNITCLDCVYSQSEIGKVRSASLLGPPLPEFTVAEKENATISAPRTIHFSSFVKHLSQVSCAVTQRLVETFIECIAGNCAATKIRPSRTDHRSENVTSFDYWASDALDMITEDSKVRQSGPSSATSASALFLQRPDLLPLQIIGQDISSVKGGFVNLSTINPEVFEARASMLLNAVLQTFMSPTGFARNLPTNFTKYGPGHIPAKGLVTVANNKSAWAEADPFNLPPPIWHLADPETPFLGASTNATVTRYTEVYKPSYAWVVLLVLSAALLFCAGAIGIIVRFATIIPNFFDPVLGLTYSNEYMPPVAQQGLLNPEERLKVLARTRVQLGYVDDGGMFKKAVFGEADRVKPLEKGTLYQ